MTSWLLIVLISTKYVTTSPSYPPMTKQTCEVALEVLRTAARKTDDTIINGSCVEIK